MLKIQFKKHTQILLLLYFVDENKTLGKHDNF